MPLAAMMGGSGFANTVKLTFSSATWTSTFNGTVYVTMATQGGTHGGNVVNNYGGGGGGGGAYITGFSVTVAVNDVLELASIFGGSQFNPPQYAVRLVGGNAFLLYCEPGHGANNFSDARGTQGGSVYIWPGGVPVASGGAGGASYGNPGSDGAEYRSGSIYAIGGGGGGSGNTASPPVNGGAGGASGVYPAVQPVGIWGAGGNGFHAGESRLSATDVTSPGETYVLIQW